MELGCDGVLMNTAIAGADNPVLMASAMRKAVEAGREAFHTEGVECYRIFIRALLDVTDNLTNRGLVPPKSVLRYDGDDPYLVVAADKGTATFSDYANAVSIEYGHWLDDAFASRGAASRLAGGRPRGLRGASTPPRTMLMRASSSSRERCAGAARWPSPATVGSSL